MIETRPLDLEHEFNTNDNSEDEEDINKKKSFITYRKIQQEVRRIKEQPQVRCSAEIDSVILMCTSDVTGCGLQ